MSPALQSFQLGPAEAACSLSPGSRPPGSQLCVWTFSFTHYFSLAVAAAAADPKSPFKLSFGYAVLTGIFLFAFRKRTLCSLTSFYVPVIVGCKGRTLFIFFSFDPVNWVIPRAVFLGFLFCFVFLYALLFLGA